jgi:RNA polymerase sigma-70 factor (ECF subfamily)
MGSRDFERQLVAFLPKMRGWALALTRDRNAAEDLLQDVASKALAAHDSFIPGTNLSAWLHRIMVNQFISGRRSARQFTDDVPEQAVPASQEDRIALHELSWALVRLPAEQQQALSMVALQERSYEEVAEVTGCTVGTLKGRVHRARLQLRTYMDGACKHAA